MRECNKAATIASKRGVVVVVLAAVVVAVVVVEVAVVVAVQLVTEIFFLFLSLRLILCNYASLLLPGCAHTHARAAAAVMTVIIWI